MVTPAIAMPRPRWPVRLVWTSATMPKTRPSRPPPHSESTSDTIANGLMPVGTAAAGGGVP